MAHQLKAEQEDLTICPDKPLSTADSSEDSDTSPDLKVLS